jgi:lysophospholipase L1-like esterase
MGYAPLVVESLRGVVEVVAAKENGADSANVLAHLDEWVIAPQPALVHLNCGLHDLKRSKADGTHRVPLERYVENLREIVRRVREETTATLVFASTTPIHDARHTQRTVDFDRIEADVRRYNAAAVGVMGELGVPMHDLHATVTAGGADELLLADGTHYTPEGYALLADAVADCVRRHLTVRLARKLPPPAAGPDAAVAYRENEARRDAAVPAPYREIAAPALTLPRDAAAWRAQRPRVLEVVRETLGDLPERPAPPRSRVVSREQRDGYTLERVAIENGVDQEIGALVLVPEGLRRRAPAVMWLHSSTPDKNQVIAPGTYGGEEALGELLVRKGYVVVAPDAYWHGERSGTGPAGPFETWREEQESLWKLHVWLGRTLWGMFVRDDQVALDYVCARPEVDAARVGVTGMSMGSTRAWWLAALDERVAAVVATACLTRYQNLIRHGQLRQHGIYYFVHGLLRHFDVEGVLALIAPRPFLALTGELDAGSPADGVRDLERLVGTVYEAVGERERFRSVLYPETGHTVTPEMRRETVEWLDRWLGVGQGQRA